MFQVGFYLGGYAGFVSSFMVKIYQTRIFVVSHSDLVLKVSVINVDGPSGRNRVTQKSIKPHTVYPHSIILFPPVNINFLFELLHFVPSNVKQKMLLQNFKQRDSSSRQYCYGLQDKLVKNAIQKVSGNK